MKKVNSVVYHKLLIQAAEAKTQHLEKLSAGILSAIGPVPEDEQVHYDYRQLQDEVYNEMWKIATHVIKYYDVGSADANKIHDRLESLADKFLEEVEQSLEVDNVIAGPLEPLLPGEYKTASRVHDNKKNGYMDLKGGGWGVLVETRRAPQPGDRVLITLEDGNTVEETVGEVLHTYPGSGGIPATDGKLGKYLVSILSQEQAERIMGGK